MEKMLNNFLNLFVGLYKEDNHIKNQIKIKLK